MSRVFLRVCLVTLFVSVPIIAQTQNPALFPRFSLSGAGYLGDFGTKLRVDPHIEGIPGTTIDLEKNLGLAQSKTLTRLTADWRPFQRHELEISYFRTQRRGDRFIDRQIVYEDTTFPIQAEVHARFDIDFYDARYTYWLRQRDNSGIGVNLGVMGMKINGELNASVPGMMVALHQDAKTQVPLPVFGLEGRYAFGNVLTSVRGSFLPNVSIKDYNGSAYLARVAGEYVIGQHLGVGAAYNYFNVNGAINKTDYHADLGMTVSGIEGFVHIVFGGR